MELLKVVAWSVQSTGPVTSSVRSSDDDGRDQLDEDAVRLCRCDLERLVVDFLKLKRLATVDCPCWLARGQVLVVPDVVNPEHDVVGCEVVTI